MHMGETIFALEDSVKAKVNPHAYGGNGESPHTWRGAGRKP